MAARRTALVAGFKAARAAEQAARIEGIAKVLWADGPSLGEHPADKISAQVLAVAGSYSYILFAATSKGKDVALRVAGLSDAAQISAPRSCQ